MKIHCAQLVEGALRSALEPQAAAAPPVTAQPAAPAAPSLLDNFTKPKDGNVRVVFLKPPTGGPGKSPA